MKLYTCFILRDLRPEHNGKMMPLCVFPHAENLSAPSALPWSDGHERDSRIRNLLA